VGHDDTTPLSVAGKDSLLKSTGKVNRQIPEFCYHPLL
jgi:NADH dehydrogenase/NADH:ubiquinone oxidoreductase subunit G